MLTWGSRKYQKCRVSSNALQRWGDERSFGALSVCFPRFVWLFSTFTREDNPSMFINSGVGLIRCAVGAISFRRVVVSFCSPPLLPLVLSHTVSLTAVSSLLVRLRKWSCNHNSIMLHGVMLHWRGWMVRKLIRAFHYIKVPRATYLRFGYII